MEPVAVAVRPDVLNVVNVADDPRRPRIEKVIEPNEVIEATGYTRPHTVHCMPGDNVVISMLGDADGNGSGGFAVLDARTFELKGPGKTGVNCRRSTTTSGISRARTFSAPPSSASRTPTNRASTMEARGAEARDDEVGAIRPVAGRAAAVPAEVVEFVAGVRHRRLMNDPSLLGVDDGEEIRRVHACALVQAGDVEELLGGGLHRLLRGGKKGSRDLGWRVIHWVSSVRWDEPRMPVLPRSRPYCRPFNCRPRPTTASLPSGASRPKSGGGIGIARRAGIRGEATSGSRGAGRGTELSESQSTPGQPRPHHIAMEHLTEPLGAIS